MLMALGCTGEIGELGEGSGPGAGARGPGSGGTTSGSGGGGGTDGLVDAPAPSPRLARLTHGQWENSVRDLFGLAEITGLSSGFPTDPKTAGYLFPNDASSLSVDQAQWGAYQRAADEVATLVMSQPSTLSAILPPDTGDDDARARQFVTDFGKRVYRRHLTATEIDDLMEVCDEAAQVATSRPPFDAGIEFLISAFLQSPFFLYRVEHSVTPVGDAIPLDGFEVASRLSYLLWDTMPDPALFDAAEGGDLDTVAGVEAQARRMLDDARAVPMVIGFHRALLEVEKFDTISPLPARFPDVSAQLPHSAQRENELFIQDLFERGQGFRELLTSNRSFVNAELAELYGLSGDYPENEFVEADLDPSTRSGVFTQVGFLAANATATEPDPIHRGAFLARHISCITISAPDGEIPPLPENTGGTNRELVASHTEKPGSNCASCHSTVINPYGFTFENYDAVGALRTTDNGFAVDTATEPLIDNEPQSVANAPELMELLADSEQANDCYAEHWVSYALGRNLSEQDDYLVKTLGEAAQRGDGIKDMLVTLVATQAFRHRSVEVQP